MAERILGPNVKRLAARFAAVEAVPPGGGMPAALTFLTEPTRFKLGIKRAVQNALAAVDAVKTAHDNPYGSDDEVIAGAILRKIDQAKTE